MQAFVEIDSLINELEAWYEDFATHDRHGDGSPRGQYQTQLQAVFSEVKGTAVLLRKDLADLGLSGEVCAVYGKFARVEREILWLRRVWYFFRDKFQQRADARFGPILRAADEVVWSCYRPFFHLSNRQERPPAPLPYIKPEFSPSALRLDQSQALDRKNADFMIVNAAFRELPVPILALPTTTIHNPWALVLIGHETGHIVEPLMEPDFNTTFQQMLRETVEQAGGTENDQDAWIGWSDEIFADLYSVLTMGPWSVWAMSQFEATEDAAMVERRFVYPAPCVRLQLMAALVRQYGLEAQIPSVPTIVPDDMTRDSGYVERVAHAITSMPQVKALATSLPYSKASYETQTPSGTFGDVEQWSRHFGKAKAAVPAGKELRSARMAAAGTAKAWSETIFGDDTFEKRDMLRELATSRIAAAGPPGVRSASLLTRRVEEAGHSLLQTLRQAEQVWGDVDAGSH